MKNMRAIKYLSLITLLMTLFVNVAIAQTSGAARDSLKRKRAATEMQAAQAKVAAEQAALQAEQLAAEKAAEQALAKAQAALVAKTEADRIAAQQAQAEQNAAQALAAQQAQTRAEEAARIAAAERAQKASLTLSTDAACALSLNGKAFGVLALGRGKTLEVASGRIRVECAAKSAQNGRISDQQTVVMLPGNAKTVAIKLAAQLSAAAPEPAAVAANRFASAAAGVVRDAVAKLEWLQSDNGKDISWQDAKSYCESRGWTLPTQTQLLSIFDRSGALSAPCGSARCKVSPLFQLTSRYGFYWSSDANGDAEAWHVALDFGTSTSSPMSESMDTRALCVRKSA